MPKLFDPNCLAEREAVNYASAWYTPAGRQIPCCPVGVRPLNLQQDFVCTRNEGHAMPHVHGEEARSGQEGIIHARWTDEFDVQVF